jgi:hypothetical protein
VKTSWRALRHRFIVRDEQSVWAGSADFTPDGLHVQDNDCAVVHGEPVARAYLEAFAGRPPPQDARVTLPDGDVSVRFSADGAAREAVLSALEHAARIRVLASAVEDPAVLEALRSSRADVAGVYDPHGRSLPGLHNRLLVADDTVVTGPASFTAEPFDCADILVIRSPSFADRYVEYVDAVAAAYR